MEHNEIFRNGLRYVPSKVAARSAGLVPDYVSRMCRAGLVEAVRHAGIWFVNEESLSRFLSEQAKEYEKFKRRKSQSAKNILAREKVAFHNRMITRPHPVLREHSERYKRRQRMNTQIFKGATLTLAAALVVGSSLAAFTYIAPAGSQARSAITRGLLHTSSQAAAISSLPFIDSLASSVYRAFCPIFRSCLREQTLCRGPHSLDTNLV